MTSDTTRKLKESIYAFVASVKKEVVYRGLRVPLVNPPISRKIYQQLWRGDYEQPEISAIIELLLPGDKVLELGSGIGVVSSLISRSKDGVQVRTYEGNPDLIPFIAQLHKLNNIKNVECRNEILVPNPTETEFSFLIHRSFAESSILTHGAIVKKSQVPCRDINDVIKEFRPDVFVCDIEGGEKLVFDGVDLTGVRVAVVELHPTLIDREAIRRVYDTCAAAGLYPRQDLSTANVVAFERVG